VVGNQGSYASGEGTSGDPFILTSTTLSINDGCYYLANADLDLGSDATLIVGATTSGNSLTISGADTTVSDFHAVIGDGASGMGTVLLTDGAEWANGGWMKIGSAGVGTLTVEKGAILTNSNAGHCSYIGADGSSCGTVIVDGAGSSWNNSGSLRVGPYGAGSLIVRNGASTSHYQCVICNGVYGSSNSTRLRLEGAGSTCSIGTGQFVVGTTNGTGRVDIADGAVLATASASLGDGNAYGVLTLYGSGSSWVNQGDVSLGFILMGYGSGTVYVANGALFANGGSLVFERGGIQLAGGYLAIKGDVTPSQVASAGLGIKVCSGVAYVNATADNITATYIDGTSNVWTSNTLHTAYGDIVDLTGYTIIAGGESLPSAPAWSDAEVSFESPGWMNSAWYGWFFSVASYEGWIWHAQHGWQYVFDRGDDFVIVWDDATHSWWYVAKSWYPAIYDYSTSTWLYYKGDSVPSRVFWNYSSGLEVSESSL